VMKMHDMIKHSDRTSNTNEKPESCYCSALPKGSGRKKMSFTHWGAYSRRQCSPPFLTLSD
jgi:hypothetical protein